MDRDARHTYDHVKLRTMDVFNRSWLHEDAIGHLTSEILDTLDSAIVLPVLLIELDANPFSRRERRRSLESDDSFETLNGSDDSTKRRSVVRHAHSTMRQRQPS